MLDAISHQISQENNASRGGIMHDPEHQDPAEPYQTDTEVETDPQPEPA